MPLYYPKKPTQTETKEVIETKTNKFLLTVRTSDTSTMLYIGGLTVWCISCQVLHNKSVANMPKIEYNETCSLTGRYKRGIDTIDILALMMAYVHDRFPNVTHITFDDYSWRSCDDQQTIDLAPFYYLMYGVTWYMSKMGATFEKEADAAHFTDANRRFQQLKLTMTWTEFDAEVTSAHPLPDSEMRRLYEGSETWPIFFSKVKEQVSIEDLCRYMAPWVKDFVRKHAGLLYESMKMIMPIVGGVPYTISPFTKRTNGGGGTRKRHRRRRDLDLQ